MQQSAAHSLLDLRKLIGKRAYPVDDGGKLLDEPKATLLALTGVQRASAFDVSLGALPDDHRVIAWRASPSGDQL